MPAPTKLTTDRVNHLNSALMVGACAAAYVAPLELFLFSYAVLGPLHYLTEISWLHDRKYFTTQRADRMLILALCALPIVVRLAGLETSRSLALATYAALGVAVVLSLVARPLARGCWIAVVAAVAALALPSDDVRTVFGLFVPTIVHVLLFTAAFVLLGALRHRSLSGAGSLGVFGLCVATFFVYAPAGAPPPPSAHQIDTYRSFAQLNVQLLDWLGFGEMSGPTQVLGSVAGQRVMRLIAFAYTYHYLNWFSKTSVIRWHEVPRWRFAAVLGLWLASLAIYAWDYRTGIAVLFSLSLTHVYLEFPLNVQSFVGIGRELNALARGLSGPASAPAPRASR